MVFPFRSRKNSANSASPIVTTDFKDAHKFGRSTSPINTPVVDCSIEVQTMTASAKLSNEGSGASPAVQRLRRLSVPKEKAVKPDAMSMGTSEYATVLVASANKVEERKPEIVPEHLIPSDNSTITGSVRHHRVRSVEQRPDGLESFPSFEGVFNTPPSKRPGTS